MSIARGFMRRSWRERVALIEATLFLLVARTGLAVLSFPAVLRWVERAGGGRRAGGPRIQGPIAPPGGDRPGHPEGPAAADGASGAEHAPLDAGLKRRLAAADAVGHRLFGDGPCLPQALVAHVWLRRADHPAHLRIGTRLDSTGAVEAHAWVESGGRVVMGDLDDLESYTPLAPGRYEG